MDVLNAVVLGEIDGEALNAVVDDVHQFECVFLGDLVNRHEFKGVLHLPQTAQQNRVVPQHLSEVFRDRPCVGWPCIHLVVDPVLLYLRFELLDLVRQNLIVLGHHLQLRLMLAHVLQGEHHGVRVLKVELTGGDAHNLEVLEKERVVRTVQVGLFALLGPSFVHAPCLYDLLRFVVELALPYFNLNEPLVVAQVTLVGLLGVELGVDKGLKLTGAHFVASHQLVNVLGILHELIDELLELPIVEKDLALARYYHCTILEVVNELQEFFYCFLVG